MTARTPPCASAGVLLRPRDASAVVVVPGRPPVRVALPRGGAVDPGSVMTAVAAVARANQVPLDVVTVDVSGVLLEAVVHGHPVASQTAAVRIVPRPAEEPALARSPAAVVERLIAHRFTVAGGHDLLGHELCPLDRAQLSRLCEALRRDGTRQVAVVGAGSPARPDHERAVADAVQAAVPGCDITVGSEFGGQGLVAREATAVVNAWLRPLARDVVDGLEQALAAVLPGVVLRVARGDGGHTMPARAAELPATALGATDAMELRGAAHLAGRDDTRVVLRRPGGGVTGHVRRGLVVVRSAQLEGIGTELVVPTAALAQHPGATNDTEQGLPTRGDPDLIACVGAATSRPTSWLDEVAVIESAQELEGVRSEAEQRAMAIATANGALPGTAHVVDLSVIAVPYSPSGTVRIRVRVAGE
ncbi:MAG: hydantoinase/oxoprolinase N-terminal domain-containing protein, partial [Janthinobacterium lividum]